MNRFPLDYEEHPEDLGINEWRRKGRNLSLVFIACALLWAAGFLWWWLA